jgi:DNA-directed RNA polymerase sigma subunit (sigma70/sigma32)
MKAGRAPVRVMTRPDLAAAIEHADLSPVEEKVIRMRYGLTVGDDTSVGGPLQALDATAQAEVADLEARAMRVMVDRGQISQRDLLKAQLKSFED